MQMLGNLLSGFIMERFGRKRTIMIGSLLVILSSALLSFAPSYEVFIILDNERIRTFLYYFRILNS